VNVTKVSSARIFEIKYCNAHRNILLPACTAVLFLVSSSVAWSKNGSEVYDESFHAMKTAIDRATAAIKRNPNDAWAFVERGVAEVKMEQFKAGLEDLNRGLRLNPSLGSSYVYDSRSRALCDAGQWKLALEDATRAIQLGPKEGWRYKERAQLYATLQQNDLAVKDFTTATHLSPKDCWCYMDRGNLYVTMHQYNQAVADFTTAIGLAPGNPKPYECRADVYEKLGRMDLARKDREMASKSSIF
jgi:tetratricopeptide (TPR) repeat protein